MCEVCNGYPGCPCCSPEPKMIECPDCGGSGYYDQDEEEICRLCNGEGKIEEEEFEPQEIN